MVRSRAGAVKSGWKLSGGCTRWAVPGSLRRVRTLAEAADKALRDFHRMTRRRPKAKHHQPLLMDPEGKPARFEFSANSSAFLFRICRGHRRSMTSRVFGLRAAQFSGLLQPAPAQQVHRHRVLRRRPQRVDARVSSIGRDIVAHDDPDARRRLFPFYNWGALCSGCVPAAKGMRSSAAAQGESRSGQAFAVASNLAH